MNLQQIGWKCPKCGTVYSPSVTYCKKCTKIEKSSDIKPMKILMEQGEDMNV